MSVSSPDSLIIAAWLAGSITNIPGRQGLLVTVLVVWPFLAVRTRNPGTALVLMDGFPSWPAAISRIPAVQPPTSLNF